MFDFLFGWRKASKCKKLIKRVQCRLKLLKTKRNSIVKQLREDVAHLLKLGYEDLAFKRAEHLVNDETTLAVYELLENFCQFIIINLSYIRKNKDCPNDINEAVSSIIFASARCGDLPELRAIRKLFSERYGQRFETTALELLPGNLVNFQVKEKLSNKSVPDDVKHKLLDQIATDYCLQPEIFAIEFNNQKQDDKISSTLNSSNDSRKSVNAKSSPGSKEFENLTRSSSESLPQVLEEMIVYLDDIEEVKHRVSCQDQRTFKFKSSVMPNNTRGEESDNVKSPRKRPKRRCISREKLSVKDLHCVIYYEKPYRKSPSNKLHRKNPECQDCCLKHPCYFHVSNGRDDQEFLPNQGLESDTEAESEFGFIDSNDSFTSVTSPVTKRAVKAPYLRAMTMPQERSKGGYKDNVSRSNSFPVQSPNHVHPKLPDYDEIAAKFMALKKDYQQNKSH